MRRSLWGIALLLVIAIGTGLWLYPNAGRLEVLPYAKDRPLSYLSKAAAGPDGGLIAIGDSRQEIVRISGEGAIEEVIVQEAASGARHDFTDIAVGDDGSVYALDTILDGYGLYVQEERIVRYPADGSEETVLYAFKGNGTNKRVGLIKGLQAAGGSVYFYINQETEVRLYRIAPQDGEPEEMLSFQLPADRYLSEIVGYEPGGIYYSTKRGAVFRVGADGSSAMAYPLVGMERTRKNFPEGLQLGADGRLYFIDRLVNSVVSMTAADSSGLRTEIDEASLKERAKDAESLEIMDLTLGADDRMIVALDDRIVAFGADPSGDGVLTKLAYDRSSSVAGWLAWIAAAALLVIAIAVLRLVYVHVLKRRVSLFFKQVFAIVPLLILAMFLLSNFIYDSFSSRMEEDMLRQLSLLARNGENLIDGDRLKRLLSPDDYRNEDYEAIYGKINALFESEDDANRKGLYSTLYKYENGELFILMDDDDGVNMYKPFPVSEENLLVLEKGEIQTNLWEDATGKWMYAIGPVYDSSGAVVGIYETGRDLNVLYESNRTIYKSIMRNIGIISIGLIVLVLAVTYYLLSSLRKLRRSVMEMANGNWDVKVDIRSQDEVGDLGEQFNRMALHIRTYIKDITSFSEASHRFVPQQFFKYLGKKGITDIHLGDQVQQNMAVMVANIRSFHQLSKQLSPKQNFDFMNGFLKRFSPYVRTEEGLISKYMGAGFMALFPARNEDALRAAVAIRRELVQYNESLAASGLAPVDLGMAIHKGPLMLGIVGEEQRMEGNVISDDVNMTATLERMSDTMGASILVTRTYFDQLRSPERFRFRMLGRVRIDGKDEPIELVDVYEGDPEPARQLKDRTKALFEKGIELCQEGRFFDARETFIEVIKVNRFDKAAKLYFYLCDEYYQKGAAEGWNGTLAV
ncbi:adenylate/guanylate cyclase domain-containing protein [Paenibacillus arenilitoris]|uniref:HAMP domain-containing protein n=1 Tax=Paenibacillus arenilitoris TaxID=2772299 RepID=A0A927CJY8_9BACL|nr:adenylate/guanylate cyclase domain-containing protein [Paenibacillus arenilitoris]MBD2867576.1 HAMP domain-containing protein [Paenibacillus arenilitoris]